jgi:hypothetical protein
MSAMGSQADVRLHTRICGNRFPPNEFNRAGWAHFVGCPVRPYYRAAVFSLVGHMREYRLYCLNDLGSLDFVETVNAADDRAAIREARNLKRRARKCEVWEGRRLVATSQADDLAA